MAPRLFLCDSGGISRQIKRLFINDSGGISRRIQRLFLRDSGGVARLVFQGYLYQGTVVAGEISSGSGSLEIRQFGWSIALFTGSTVMGSISPSADINGNAIAAVYGSETGSPVPSSYGTLLAIAGNHPQNYFNILQVDSKSFTSASATYSQSGGYTEWSWTGSGSIFGAILVQGGSHSVTIQ